MKKTSDYSLLHEGDGIDLFFLEENGSCSLLHRVYSDAKRCWESKEVIVASDDLTPLIDYPTSCKSLSSADRMAFLFGSIDGYNRFKTMCEENGVKIRELR